MLTAYTDTGHIAWRTPIGAGAALKDDSTSIDAVGDDVVALVSPNQGPSAGHVVGVDGATGQVNMRSGRVPALNIVGSVTCAAGALYVINDQMPAPGPVKPGHVPGSLTLVSALATATGKLLWQRRFVVHPLPDCGGQGDFTPASTRFGLLWFRAPDLCSAGHGKSDVVGQLFARATGRIVWQTTYPAALGPAATNGALVAVPSAAGRVAVRAYATGRPVRAFALATSTERLQFATSDSVVADTTACPKGPTGGVCRTGTTVYSWNGRQVEAFPAGTNQPPTIAAGSRLCAATVRTMFVYRLASPAAA